MDQKNDINEPENPSPTPENMETVTSAQTTGSAETTKSAQTTGSAETAKSAESTDIRNHTEKMDTDRIQKAIEKVTDDVTTGLPHLKTAPKTRSFSAEHDSIHRWFFTFMCMNIPIAGWIYLLYLAFSKKQTDRREFARAYLFYKLLFLLLSALILGILVYIGLEVLDKLLAYMEML